MAAQREVKVVINGEEFVSKAAKEAEGGLESFTGKIGGWFKSFVDLKAAWDMVSGAASKLAGVVTGSFDALDAMNNSQRKLEGTAKLTGLSLDYLQEIAGKARTQFGLSRTVANDLATEVAKLESKSGGAAKAVDLLSGFLNIGAARGLTAAETMQAVQQSLLGIDEGTDKLFGKNPSGLWADYAGVIGKSAGKFTDMDKMAALAFATVQGGTVTGGSYAAFLDTATGKQEQFTNKITDSKIALAEALNPLRLWSLEIATKNAPLIEELALLLGGTLVYAVSGVGKAFNWLRGITALVVEGFGMLFFNADMVAWGAKQVDAANKLGGELNKLSDDFHTLKDKVHAARDGGDKMTGSLKDVIPSAKGVSSAFAEVANPLDRARTLFQQNADTVGGIGPRAKMSADEVRAYGKAHTQVATEATAKAKDVADATKSFIESLHRALQFESGVTASQNKTLADSFRLLPPLVQEAFKKEHTDGFNTAVANIKTETDKIWQNIKNANPDLKQFSSGNNADLKQMSGHLSDSARTLLDIGDAFGLVDDQAKNLLTSCINIGDSIGKMIDVGKWSFAGVAGILGGVASIVSNMMAGNAERNQIMRDNTRQMERLRTEGVPLSNKASGDTISKARDFFTAENIAGLKDPLKASGVLQNMFAQGLTFTDLESLAADLGINIKDKNGNFLFSQIGNLGETIRQNPTFGTSISQSFTDQLKFFRETQTLSGSSGVQSTKDLTTFLQNVGGVSALNGIDFSDPTAAISRLFQIRANLNNGSLDPGTLGKLSGQQFADLLAEMIQSLQQGGSGDTGTSGPVGNGPTGTDGSGGTGGTGDMGTDVPVLTIGDVVQAVHEQTTELQAFHVAALDFAERTADNTAATVEELRGLRSDLTMASSDRAALDTALGRDLAVQRRLSGSSDLL